jgi:ABC-2 type transport system ATP-binding protein
MAILEVNQVSKSFGEIQAVNDLSFAIEEGHIFGLLGPNGAGKTTTIRMIMGILMPDRGSIQIFNQPNSLKASDAVGYLPEERGLYKKMTVIDTLIFFAEIKGVPRKDSLKPAEEWLQRFDLTEWRDKKIEELSKGMQQKLQFISTILHRPRLIILDEPFSGLDPVNTTLLKDIMLELKKQGTTIIFSTHLMEQVEKLCESICLINRGKNVLNGALPAIKAQFGRNRVRLSYEGKADFLADRSLVSAYDDYGQYVEIRPVEKTTPQQILAKALEQVTVKSFEVAEPSLNEIFITVVTN